MSAGLVLGHDFGLLHGWVCSVRCWRGVKRGSSNCAKLQRSDFLRGKIAISVKTYRYKYCSWIRTKLAQLKQTIDHPYTESTCSLRTSFNDSPAAKVPACLVSRYDWDKTCLDLFVANFGLNNCHHVNPKWGFWNFPLPHREVDYPWLSGHLHSLLPQ